MNILKKIIEMLAKMAKQESKEYVEKHNGLGSYMKAHDKDLEHDLTRDKSDNVPAVTRTVTEIGQPVRERSFTPLRMTLKT